MALSPLTQAGLPEPIAALLVSFERSAARGQLAVAPGAVRALTAAEPTGVRQFLSEQRAARLA